MRQMRMWPVLMTALAFGWNRSGLYHRILQ